MKVREDTGLGTLLRHLVELLDGGVEAVYREQGLDVRSRFTPVIRHLEDHGPSTLRQIADTSGVTHSAICQTVDQMVKYGIVETAPGKDGRVRIVQFTAVGQEILPQLHELWSGIWHAADELSEELGFSLPNALRQAIGAVERRPFRDRIIENLPASGQFSV